jgi:hypothetical protein
VTVLARDGGVEEWPLISKRAVADRLLDRIVALWTAAHDETAKPGSRALTGSGARR